GRLLPERGTGVEDVGDPVGELVVGRVVDVQGDGFDADGPDLVEVGGVAVARQPVDGVALRRELARDREADAPRGTGNEDPFSSEHGVMLSHAGGQRETAVVAIANDLQSHVDGDFCYLTTRWRVAGNPREIEIWFALDTETPTTLFLMAGGGDGSDWVRNLQAEPAVTVRVGDTTYAARARVVDPESDEDER